MEKVKIVKVVKIMKMGWAAGVWAVYFVKMMKIVKMECAAGGVGCVPFMKIVKMVWAAGVWVCTPSGNGENFENGEKVKMVKIGRAAWVWVVHTQ